MGQKIYFNFVNVRKYLRENKKTGKRRLYLSRIEMPCRWSDRNGSI
ncbi:hypothetical protein C804_04928 [Lachnospiraceae bacterium A4]|jgi:hypothetical protein|nr:hypothetical protein C804_04928 [Lachnospiraceae bacterium A4]